MQEGWCFLHPFPNALPTSRAAPLAFADVTSCIQSLQEVAQYRQNTVAVRATPGS